MQANFKKKKLIYKSWIAEDACILILTSVSCHNKIRPCFVVCRRINIFLSCPFHSGSKCFFCSLGAAAFVWVPYICATPRCFCIPFIDCMFTFFKLLTSISPFVSLSFIDEQRLMFEFQCKIFRANWFHHFQNFIGTKHRKRHLLHPNFYRQ